MEIPEEILEAICGGFAERTIEINESEIIDIFRKGVNENDGELGFVYCFIDVENYEQIEENGVVFNYEYVTMKHPKAPLTNLMMVVLNQLQSRPDVVFVVFDFIMTMTVTELGLKRSIIMKEEK